MANNDYVQRVNHAVQTDNGPALASLVAERTLWRDWQTVLSQLTSEAAVQKFCQRIQNPEYRELLANVLESARLCRHGQFVEGFVPRLAAFTKLLSIFKSTNNWLVPVLHVLTHDCRVLAYKADDQKTKQTGVKSVDTLRQAEMELKKGVNATYNDRAGDAPDSKRWGVLYVVNQLFKIYFKLNTIRLCKNLVKTIDSMEKLKKPPLSAFGYRDTVTYKYYTGRLSMFEDNYQAAEAQLDFALRHCLKTSKRNKRLILQYLVPVKILIGNLPRKELLQAYSLQEYEGVADGVRTGNLRVFNENLEKYQSLFVRRGIYLVLEKIKMLVYRTLFKKISLIAGTIKLRLSLLQSIVAKQGVDVDTAEVECILANLIFMGYIRGYIAHEKQFLVLAKTNAFPSISQVK